MDVPVVRAVCGRDNVRDDGFFRLEKLRKEGVSGDGFVRVVRV